MGLSRPEKPTNNAFAESFNGKGPAECIDQNWFLSLDDAVQRAIRAGLLFYPTFVISSNHVTLYRVPGEAAYALSAADRLRLAALGTTG